MMIMMIVTDDRRHGGRRCYTLHVGRGGVTIPVAAARQDEREPAQHGGQAARAGPAATALAPALLPPAVPGDRGPVVAVVVS